MEFDFMLVVGLILMAFFAEYLDSSLGMGYGTTLTPLLLLMGFTPLQIVPAILFSEFLTGTLAGFTHHRLGNVDFSLKSKTDNERITFSGIKKRLSSNTKMMMIIASCSILGATSSVFIAVNLTEYLLKMYIGVLVLIIGIYILYSRKRNIPFSWLRLIVMCVIASCNK